MNFDEAIAAHADWKAKLRSYLKKADKSLNASIIEQDNQCTLGKWIYGDGIIYKSNQLYQELVTEHAKFHKCAGKLVEAEAMIDAQSDYTEISMTVVTKIRKLRTEIEK